MTREIFYWKLDWYGLKVYVECKVIARLVIRTAEVEQTGSDVERVAFLSKGDIVSKDTKLKVTKLFYYLIKLFN